MIASAVSAQHEAVQTAAAPLRTKSHYEILDGLRGVAALMVVIFHTFEAYADENRFKQIINHGYLAVDFFFLLSGFVVAYAYDDRWSDRLNNRLIDRLGGMSLGDFFKRRLIRLQPMVVFGNVVGAALFYLQSGPVFPLIAHTPVWKMLIVMLVGFTMLPLLPSMDIRGWQEMHPLDGPAWSLFFEYLANIFYALGLRKLSKRALGVFVFLSGLFLLQYTLFGGRGDVIGGWAVNSKQMHIGFVRMLYPFFAGILLMRLGKRIHIRHTFLVCSLLLIVSFSLPRFGSPTHLWINGLYESFCILILFPLVVALGAGDRVTSPATTRVCKFLGDLSYPLYITHYPLIYVYTAYVIQRKTPAPQGALWGALLLLTAVTLAYAALKIYDEPLRRFLQRRWLPRTV